MKCRLSAFASALLVAALSLTGCVTPTAPESATDTLFVVPITFDRATMGNNNYPASSAGFVMKIAGLSTPALRAQLRLEPNADYVFLHGLPPGRYQIREISFVDNYGKTLHRGLVDARFNLEAGALTIFPLTFEYRTHMEGNTVYWGLYPTAVSPSEAERLFAILSNQGVLSHWVLDRYTASVPVFAAALRHEQAAGTTSRSVETK